MKLHMQTDSGMTLIQNTFIDRYMPAANGEFVKLYLYLLRCAGSGQELSISSIADFFDHTEKDVKRALSYWEKLDLLRLHYDSSDNITDITFLSGEENHSSVPSGMSAVQMPADGAKEKEMLIPDSPSGTPAVQAPADAPEIVSLSENSAELMPSGEENGEGIKPVAARNSSAFNITVPGKKELTKSRRSQLSDNEEIRQLIFVEEQYIKRPLTPTEIGNLMYFYDCLHFSQDLIEYLLEYCATKGNPGSRYMEKVAQEWYKAGITTVEQAKQSSSLYNRDYYTVFSAMGIRGRSVTPAEKEFVDRWTGIWGFSMDLITQACARTIRQTHEPSFEYTDGILKNWHENNVHSLSDVIRLDQEHARKQPVSSGSSDKMVSGKASRSNRFTRVPQREYDWRELEKDLLQSQHPGTTFKN